MQDTEAHYDASGTPSAPPDNGIVSALLDSIVIGPAVRGRKIFDPTRVTPNWRA